MAILQNFSVDAGDDTPIGFDIVGSGVDLLDAQVFWSVYEQMFGVPTGSAILVKSNLSGGGDIDVIDSPPSFTVKVDAADTVSLLGNYYHEAKVIDASGNTITVTQGIMTVNFTEPVP